MTDAEFDAIREEFIEAGVAVLDLKRQIAEAEEHLYLLSDEYGEAFSDEDQIEMAQEGWRRIGLDEETIDALTAQLNEFREQVEAYVAEQAEQDDDPMADFTVIGDVA